MAPLVDERVYKHKVNIQVHQANQYYEVLIQSPKIVTAFVLI